MKIIILTLSALLGLWSLLAIYWLAPELANMAIQNYDISDSLFMALIILMGIALLMQEKRLSNMRD